MSKFLEENRIDQILWEDRPSQISNLLIFFLFWFTIIYPLIAYLNTRFTKYQLTSEVLIITTGILNQNVEQTELYRIKDYSIFKPLYLRIFGLGHLILTISDKNSKYIRLEALEDVEKIKNLIRNNVEIARKKTGTKEMDFA